MFKKKPEFFGVIFSIALAFGGTAHAQKINDDLKLPSEPSKPKPRP